MAGEQFAGKPTSQPLFSGPLEPAQQWLRDNIDVFPKHVDKALTDFLSESLNDVIAKGAKDWAVSMTISKKRKVMLDSPESRPVLMIHLIAWPPNEMIEVHFGIRLEGKVSAPEHLQWALDNTHQYVCGLVVEEGFGGDRKVVEFMKTFKREQLEHAERAVQAVLSKFTKKQGE